MEAEQTIIACICIYSYYKLGICVNFAFAYERQWCKPWKVLQFSLFPFLFFYKRLVSGQGKNDLWNQSKTIMFTVQGKKINFRAGHLWNQSKRIMKTICAPAGNRTRVCTVAGYYSTTRPLVLVVSFCSDDLISSRFSLEYVDVDACQFYFI